MVQESNAGSGQGASESQNMTVLAIPSEQAPAVIEFIESLKNEDADVSGHMLNRPIFGGGIRTSLSLTIKTTTDCIQEITGALGTDWTCGDHDKDEV